MKFLVTGSAGFIGKHLCLKLIREGNKVIGIDNLKQDYSLRLKKLTHFKLKGHEDYKFFPYDILSKKAILKKLDDQKIDCFIHLAANTNVRDSIKNSVYYAKNNLVGTQTALEIAKELNCQNFVFASSSAVYGEDCDIPFTEECNSLKPISPYAATKKAGEDLCYTYHHLHDMSIHCLRLFTVYGKWQRPDLAIHKFSKQFLTGNEITMYGDGTSSRDYTYIDDIIDGVYKSVQRLKEKNNEFESINLGSAKRTKLKQLIKLISDKLGIESDIKRMESPDGDVSHTCANISKAKSLLNYKPSTSIEEGLDNFCGWVEYYYKKNPDIKTQKQ